MKEKDIQEEILKAAINVFIAKGKSGARMQEIADEAGVNKMLLHYYYRNKDLLFQEVLKSVITELYHSVMEISDHQATFKDTILIFIERHFEFLYEKRDILQFLFWEVSRGGKDNIEIVKETYRKIGGNPLDTLIKKAREAIKNGEIKEVDPLNLIFNLFSLDISFFFALPFIQLYSELNKTEVDNLLENRKKEIFRLLWNDIKVIQ